CQEIDAELDRGDTGSDLGFPCPSGLGLERVAGRYAQSRTVLSPHIF
ncbi:hypothetical protein A2U01_0113326, partial [Trifolium medium]|nr:hypothetical protein [Trifolium medium]